MFACWLFKFIGRSLPSTCKDKTAHHNLCALAQHLCICGFRSKLHCSQLTQMKLVLWGVAVTTNSRLNTSGTSPFFLYFTFSGRSSLKDFLFMCQTSHSAATVSWRSLFTVRFEAVLENAFKTNILLRLPRWTLSKSTIQQTPCSHSHRSLAVQLYF